MSKKKKSKKHKIKQNDIISNEDNLAIIDSLYQVFFRIDFIDGVVLT